MVVSRAGSAEKVLIDAIRERGLSAQLCAVISNCADFNGLAYATNAGIPGNMLDHRAFPSRAEFDRALEALITPYAPEFVVLAGFNRILSPEFVDRYRGRLLKIQPSLLPTFRGLRPVDQALAAGAGQHGATIHFVTPEVDSGPAVLQACVPVHGGNPCCTGAGTGTTTSAGSSSLVRGRPVALDRRPVKAGRPATQGTGAPVNNARYLKAHWRMKASGSIRLARC